MPLSKYFRDRYDPILIADIYISDVIIFYNKR